MRLARYWLLAAGTDLILTVVGVGYLGSQELNPLIAWWIEQVGIWGYAVSGLAVIALLFALRHSRWLWPLYGLWGIASTYGAWSGLRIIGGI
jgi:hypothetical protein